MPRGPQRDARMHPFAPVAQAAGYQDVFRYVESTLATITGFAGVSLQGSTLRTDTSENRELYGKDLTAREVVRGGVTTPAAAEVLMKELARY